MRHTFCFVALLALAGSSSARAQPATPLALVVGNAAYTAFPKLPTCEMSANLAAAALTRAGFKVTRLSDPSNARLGTAISDLGDAVAATPGARSILYYCGYVSSYADRLFLLPVEARLERPPDVLTQGIVARLLMGSAVSADSRAGLVVMDVAQPKGTPEGFDSMLRGPDAAHGGLAVAALPADGGLGAAPMASVLANLLQGPTLDLKEALAGLPKNPALSRTTLLAVRPPQVTSLLLGEAVASPPSDVPGRPPTPNPAERRRIQLALQRLGYLKAPVTGTFTPATETAIRRFQTESGAEGTGRLTRSQMDQLLK